MVKTKRQRRHIGGTRKTTKIKLMECLNEKSKLEKFLEEFKESVDQNFKTLEKSNRNLSSEIEVLRTDLGDLEKDNKKLQANVGDLEKDNKKLHKDVGDLEKDNKKLHTDNKKLHSDVGDLQTDNKKLHTDNKKLHTDNKKLHTDNKKLHSDVGDLQTDNQRLHVDVGELQAKLIMDNIVTSIQDINGYKKLTYNGLIPNIGPLERLRKDRNNLNHFILDNDSIVVSENKLQFIYEKIQEIQQKRPEIIRDVNRYYKNVVTDIMAYLQSIKINYDPVTYAKNKSKYEFWWNRLP
jgi:DNA repair exonuclease SbcCD ATPase subunit